MKRYYNLEGSHKILFDVNNKNHNPFNNTTKMLAAVHDIIHTLQACILPSPLHPHPQRDTSSLSLSLIIEQAFEVQQTSSG